MIFAGDVAIADDDLFEFPGFPDALLESPWCFNLEGAIREPGCPLPTWGVANSHRWMESLRRFMLAPVFLGNNHIHDIPNFLLLFLYHYLWQGIWRAGRVGFCWARLRADVMRLIEYKALEMRLRDRLPVKVVYGLGRPDPRVPQFD